MVGQTQQAGAPERGLWMLSTNFETGEELIPGIFLSLFHWQADSQLFQGKFWSQIWCLRYDKQICLRGKKMNTCPFANNAITSSYSLFIQSPEEGD